MAPTPAATLILFREHRGQLQIYLIKRSPQSGFMAGMYVFPGGTVDRNDHDKKLLRSQGNLNQQHVRHLLAGDMPISIAAAYASAAIRECLEEIGVFFAQTDGRKPHELEQIAQLAQSSERGPGWFNEVVHREEWVLDFEALLCWSHWITPPQMKHRYDTRFYLAAMPRAQTCRPDRRETSDGLWVTPERALRDNLSGLLPLSPPTLVTLHQLLSYTCSDELLRVAGSSQWGDAITPRLVALEAGALILEPWDPEYDQCDIAIGRESLASALLGAEDPFSRLWYSKGIWRPVAVC